MRLPSFALLLAAAMPVAAQPAPNSGADMVDTPVLARTVEKGERLAPADFTLAPMSAAMARRAIPASAAAGKEAIRRLPEGSAVRATDLLTPQMVKRGDTVIIAVRAGPLSITTSGRALSGGATGDMVRVLNIETNRTLNAVVEDTGHVRVVT